MNPAIPPPPKPGAGGDTLTSSTAGSGPGASCSTVGYHPATELPPSTTTVVTPSSQQEHKSTTTAPAQECVLGGVHHSPSEEDIKMYGKPVHVHGSLSKHEPTHPPVHHDPHGQINYAKAAKEEMHEMHEHPRGVGAGEVLLPGAKSGVEMWDKVEEELPSRRSKRH